MMFLDRHYSEAATVDRVDDETRSTSSAVAPRRTAVLIGKEGRLGAAFARRLSADEFLLETRVAPPRAKGEGRVYLFDCAYDHDALAAHVESAAAQMAAWRCFDGIFIPSSMWVCVDTSYGRAKLAIEQLAAFYRSLGANIVTDRIGCFPGDGGVPDPADRFIDMLVTGDELYARVMGALLKDEDA